MVISKTVSVIYAVEAGVLVGAAALAAVPVNYEGIALILGAFGVLITTVGTFVVSMVTLARQGRLVVQQEVIHGLVNSQSEKLNKAIEAGALARGKIQGALEERNKQSVPKT